MFFDVANGYIDNIYNNDIIFLIKQLFMKKLFFGLVFLLPLFLISCSYDSLENHCGEKVVYTYKNAHSQYYLGFKQKNHPGVDLVEVEKETFHYYAYGSVIDCGKIK